ncbi:hypothetical protein LIA77_06021 [Sarocladium implicatum]|nr:hypothetical protein LIA77_06021 [Sarocladium implicatum]
MELDAPASPRASRASAVLLHPAVMAKFNIWVALPAYASLSFISLYLLSVTDAFRNPSVGGVIAVIFSVPLAMSFSALLALDALQAYESPWEPAHVWYSFLHETAHGALLLFIAGFLWFWVLASVTVSFILAVFGMGGNYTSFLNLIAYIPLIGWIIAMLLHVSNAILLLGLFAYLIYTGFAALKRLITARRTGFVENGAPIQSSRSADEDLEADFGGWQSNRG